MLFGGPYFVNLLYMVGGIPNHRWQSWGMHLTFKCINLVHSKKKRLDLCKTFFFFLKF